MDLEQRHSELYNNLFDEDGVYILDRFDSLTFDQLRSALYNAYLYHNPWHETDQSSYYDYKTFDEMISEWCNESFYRQHMAARLYMDFIHWLEG